MKWKDVKSELIQVKVIKNSARFVHNLLAFPISKNFTFSMSWCKIFEDEFFLNEKFFIK